MEFGANYKWLTGPICPVNLLTCFFSSLGFHMIIVLSSEPVITNSLFKIEKVFLYKARAFYY